ncbi:endonuclease/exonuclease/phosphatase family protein [Candidatus Roizmanbacteria bacterium]|nr:endonuclease/exonuclease/phosphatase family protein [Candidatus Roizmanbacteria bacterium]
MKLKFLNLNIWLGGMLFRSALKFLKAENADIITLQEVYNGHGPILESGIFFLEIFNEPVSK